MKFFINGRFLVQNITGVQRVAHEFVDALDSLIESDPGFSALSPEILVPRAGELTTEHNFKHISVQRVGYFRGHLWEQLELPFYSRRSPLICLGNLAPLMSLFHPNQAVMAMVHDLSYRYFPEAYSASFRRVYEWVIPQVLSKADLVVTVSEAEKRAIEREYPGIKKTGRLVAAQNGGVSDSRQLGDSVEGLARRQNLCLYVGSLTKRKNAQGIIEAGITLVRKHGVEMVFIGSSGVSFEGVEYNLPEDVKDKFQFLGQINDPLKIFEYYRRAKLLLFPSFYEASPLPPIEAMSFGLPVVASSIPSLLERCGDAAEFCEANDNMSIVGAAERLLLDQQRWMELQQLGLAQAQKFSWRKQVKDTLTLFGLVADRNS